MSQDDFARYVQDQHLALVRKLPGLRRPVVNRGLSDPNSPPPAYDAVAEDWFDDLAAMGAAFASAEGQAVIADAANLLDMTRLQILVVNEDDIPCRRGPATARKGPRTPPACVSSWTRSNPIHGSGPKPEACQREPSTQVSRELYRGSDTLNSDSRFLILGSRAISQARHRARASSSERA